MPARGNERKLSGIEMEVFWKTPAELRGCGEFSIDQVKTTKAEKPLGERDHEAFCNFTHIGGVYRAASVSSR
jgi:hypothetical protein